MTLGAYAPSGARPVTRDLTYTTTVRGEIFGGQSLRIHCLESLEKTIDEVFNQLTVWGEQELLDQYCPYFGVIWPAGRTLADWVQDKGFSFLAGKTILEIGCGLAVPSLLAAKMGARVTVSDLHSEVPKFLQKNIELNQLKGIDFQALDWRDHHIEKGAFDIILGSDLVYEKQSPETLATFLDTLANDATTIVITDPGRFYLRDFQNAMADRGFLLQGDSLMGGGLDARGERIILMIFKRATLCPAD